MYRITFASCCAWEEVNIIFFVYYAFSTHISFKTPLFIILYLRQHLTLARNREYCGDCRSPDCPWMSIIQFRYNLYPVAPTQKPSYSYSPYNPWSHSNRRRQYNDARHLTWGCVWGLFWKLGWAQLEEMGIDCKADLWSDFSVRSWGLTRVGHLMEFDTKSSGPNHTLIYVLATFTLYFCFLMLQDLVYALINVSQCPLHFCYICDNLDNSFVFMPPAQHVIVL